MQKRAGIPPVYRRYRATSGGKSWADYFALRHAFSLFLDTIISQFVQGDTAILEDS